MGSNPELHSEHFSDEVTDSRTHDNNRDVTTTRQAQKLEQIVPKVVSAAGDVYQALPSETVRASELEGLLDHLA